MPPKTAKKDASPVVSALSEEDKMSINELLFPKTTIVGIAKKHETDTRKLVITKDTQTALVRASTVFLNYLMNEARSTALHKGRRSVNADDVFDSVRELGLGEGFNDQLHVLLQQYNDSMELKKKLRQQLKESNPDADPSKTKEEEVEDDDEHMEEEDEEEDEEEEGNSEKVVGKAQDEEEEEEEEEGTEVKKPKLD